MDTTAPGPGRRRIALAGLALGLALFAARGATRAGIDLGVFWRAGGRFAAGEGLYAAPGEYPYRYAPGVAALFAPLSALAFPQARALWAWLSAALAFSVSLALEARLGGRAFAVALAWAVLAQPLAHELAHGQVDLLVLALAFAAFELEDRGREIPAGALVAIAAALKVAPVVLALDWIVRRRWRPFAGAAAAGAALALATVARYGAHGAVATQSSDAGEMVGALQNQSLWAMARSLGLGAAGGAAASIALLALALSRPQGGRRRFALLAAIPLVSAYGWPQLFLLCVPLLAQALAAGGATAWVAGCAAAMVSILGYDVVGPRAEAWAQGHRLLGGCLLVAVVAAMVLRPRAASPRRTCSS